MESKKFISAVKSNLGTKLLMYPIGFLASVLVARFLGPSGRGVFAFILIINSFLLPIFSFGFGAGVTYLISSKKYKPEAVISSVLYFSAAIGIIAGLSIYFAYQANILGETAAEMNNLEVILLSVSQVFVSIYFFLSRVSFGKNDFNFLNYITIFNGLFHPITSVVLVYYFKLEILGLVLSVSILNVLCVIFIFKRLQIFKVNPHLDFIFLKECFLYGVKSWPGEIAIRANVRLDQIILAMYFQPHVLGIYSVGVLLAEIVWVLPDSVGTVLFNKLAGERDQSKKVEVTNLFHVLLFYSSIVISIGILIVSTFFIIPYGFGSEFSESSKPLIVLLLGNVCFVTSKVLTKIFSGSGNVGITSKVMIVGAFISISCYIIFIPIYGMMAAATSSAVGYIVVSLLSIYYYTSKFSSKISDLFIITPSLRNIIFKKY